MLSGFDVFKNLNYEIFVAQHIYPAATLLWQLHTHVPAYAAYITYVAVGFVAFDRSAQIIWMAFPNTHGLGRLLSKAPGYITRLKRLPEERVELTIEAVDFD